MEVNVNQAIKIFFSKSSFEMIYMEAFANALDANATQFNVSVELDDYSNLQNLKITIEDNGEGFTDKRYSKFSKLLDVEEKTHKGLGRLVYLCYFDKVSIISFYDKGKKRTFEFTDDFDGKSDKVEIISRKKVVQNSSFLDLTEINSVRTSTLRVPTLNESFLKTS